MLAQLVDNATMTTRCNIVFVKYNHKKWQVWIINHAVEAIDCAADSSSCVLADQIELFCCDSRRRPGRVHWKRGCAARALQL
eukprot:6202321-Pleurochrysis_carterae.AAC.2